MANTTSSAYAFDQNFSIDEIIADAYERLGLVGTAGHQIKTARIQGSPAKLLIDREDEVTRTSAIANRIDYDFQKSLIDFTGNVSIQEGGNQISSEYLVYNIKNQSIQAQSESKNNSKVKITYTPNINKDRMTKNSKQEK